MKKLIILIYLLFTPVLLVSVANPVTIYASQESYDAGYQRGYFCGKNNRMIPDNLYEMDSDYQLGFDKGLSDGKDELAYEINNHQSNSVVVWG